MYQLGLWGQWSGVVLSVVRCDNSGSGQRSQLDSSLVECDRPVRTIVKVASRVWFRVWRCSGWMSRCDAPVLPSIRDDQGHVKGASLFIYNVAESIPFPQMTIESDDPLW